MTHYAGQMLPWGHSAAVSPYWVVANGRFFPARLVGDYHKRHGFVAGVGGIYLLRVPPGPLTGNSRWLVLLRDDPTQPDLPADTPTASRPPTAAGINISIINPSGGSFPAGPVAVSGALGVANTVVQGAPVSATGVVGAFTALTTTGTTFSGSVAMNTVGAGQRIRVRVASATYNYVNSNLITITAAAGDPEEPPSRPQLPQRPKRGG